MTAFANGQQPLQSGDHQSLRPVDLPGFSRQKRLAARTAEDMGKVVSLLISIEAVKQRSDGLSGNVALFIINTMPSILSNYRIDIQNLGCDNERIFKVQAMIDGDNDWLFQSIGIILYWQTASGIGGAFDCDLCAIDVAPGLMFDVVCSWRLSESISGRGVVPVAHSNF